MSGAREENARQVRAAITEAVLAELSRGIPPEKMTVVAIAAAAGVSRVSFYRYYNRMTEVLPRYLRESAGELLHGKPWTMGLRQLFELWGAPGRVAEGCVLIGEETLLYRALQETLASETDDYRAAALAGAFVGSLVTWIENGRTVPPGSAISALRAML